LARPRSCAGIEALRKTAAADAGPVDNSMILLLISRMTGGAAATAGLNLSADNPGPAQSLCCRRHDDTKMTDYRFAACAGRSESSGERFFISQFAIWRMFA
jgi:hypothetical protein